MGSGSSTTAHSSTSWAPSATADAPRRISKSGYDITPLTAEQREAAAAGLTPHQRDVALASGTERAFTGKTVDGTPHDSKAKGLYVSAVGGLPLFSSDTKFDSGVQTEERRFWGAGGSLPKSSTSHGEGRDGAYKSCGPKPGGAAVLSADSEPALGQTGVPVGA